MTRIRFIVGLVLVGLALAIGLALRSLVIVQSIQDQAHPGWQVIRPPNELDALALQGESIWAGGKDGVFSIDRASGKVVQNLTCDIPLTYVKALLVDRQGVLWIGHIHGLSRFDGNTCRTISTSAGLPDERVNALFEDRGGRIWVGTWGGAVVQAGKGWQLMNQASGLAEDMVNAILQDEGGGMWFGSYVAPRGGISFCQDGRCHIFSTQNGMPHNNVTSIIQSRDGDVWAGVGLLDRGGAVRFHRADSGWQIAQVLTKADGLAGEKVRSIFQDRSGAIWFGSEYDGLARWMDGQWSTFTEQDGLSNPEIKAILQDPAGGLWLATRDGLTHITSEALNSIR